MFSPNSSKSVQKFWRYNQSFINLLTKIFVRSSAGNYFPFEHIILSSIQFSHSVMSDSLRPHVLQHARPPCHSPTPGVHSDLRPSSQWCHPAISPSVIPFFSCPQSLPGSESFPMNQLFAWGGQSIGVSASTSVLPMKTQNWSPLGWTGWISLKSMTISTWVYFWACCPVPLIYIKIELFCLFPY